MGQFRKLQCWNLDALYISGFVEYYFDLCASNKVAVIREVEDNDGNGYEIVSRCPRIGWSIKSTCPHYPDFSEN